MNQENYVCSMLTPNIMNEHDCDMNYAYDISTNMIMITARYVYGIVYDRYSLCIKLRLRCYIVDDLGIPQSFDEGTVMNGLCLGHDALSVSCSSGFRFP